MHWLLHLIIKDNTIVCIQILHHPDHMHACTVAFIEVLVIKEYDSSHYVMVSKNVAAHKNDFIGIERIYLYRDGTGLQSRERERERERERDREFSGYQHNFHNFANTTADTIFRVGTRKIVSAKEHDSCNFSVCTPFCT